MADNTYTVKKLGTGESTTERIDVGAAAIIDLGQKSLERKLHPAERPQPSWKVLLLIAAFAVMLVALAMIFGQ